MTPEPTLRIGRCPHGHTTHPYRATCPVDGGPMAPDHRTPTDARLVSWSRIVRPPTGFEAPLFVGMFRLSRPEDTMPLLVLATLEGLAPDAAPDPGLTWRLEEDPEGHVRATPA